MDILEFSLQVCQEQKNLQEIVMTQEKKKKKWCYASNKRY